MLTIIYKKEKITDLYLFKTFFVKLSHRTDDFINNAASRKKSWHHCEAAKIQQLITALKCVIVYVTFV